MARIGYAPGERAVAGVAQAAIDATASPSGPQILVAADSGGFGFQADVEVQRANAIARLPGLVAVVGHGGSRSSLAAAPVYNEAGVVQIVPNGTSRLLRNAGPWTFRLAADDSVEGAFIGRFVAEKLGARRVSIFYQNDEYGLGLRDGVAAELARRGVAVLFTSPVVAGGDLATLVDVSLRSGRPDVVISGGQPAETGRLAALFAERLGSVQMVGGDGALLLPGLAEAAGAAADSIYIATFWLSDATDSAGRAFAAAFAARVGRPPVGSDAMSYDALMLAATAIRAVGTDRGAVREYLRSLGRERPPYPGVTGPIAFALPARSGFIMIRLRNGAQVRVETSP